jgi:hypothetical protein
VKAKTNLKKSVFYSSPQLFFQNNCYSDKSLENFVLEMLAETRNGLSVKLLLELSHLKEIEMQKHLFVKFLYMKYHENLLYLAVTELLHDC